MTNEVSELRETLLATQFSINALEAQQSELADKIKSAITKGNTQELPELRREMIALETFELPLAQASAAEAAIQLFEAEAAEFERQAGAAHQNLDVVSNRRNERMRQISEEYRDLQIDASGEIAEATRALMQAKHDANQRREEAAKYRAQLEQLRKQVAA